LTVHVYTLMLSAGYQFQPTESATLFEVLNTCTEIKYRILHKWYITVVYIILRYILKIVYELGILIKFDEYVFPLCNEFKATLPFPTTS